MGQALIPPDAALPGLLQARLCLGEGERRLFLNGAAILPAGWESLPKGTPLRAYVEGRFLGLAKAEAGGIKMILFLEEENTNHG